MFKIMLTSKIHGAIVTETRLDYEGSIEIDEDLLNAANILPFEQVHVWNKTNGKRFITYAIAGKQGSGIISVNGGAAREVQVNDQLVIAAFSQVSNGEYTPLPHILIIKDSANKVWEKK